MNGPAAVVGFSGGVTSAWCAGWAKRHYPASRITLLFHDTKEEHEDTYRFIREMSEALGMPVTERSDGRSVTQLFRDEGYLGNNQQTFCSRILKAEQGSAFIRDLKSSGETDIHKIIGYSAQEPKRVQRMVGFCANEGITARFPVIEEQVTKQQCADWVRCEMGVRPPWMYEHFDHANCMGCVRGGRAYWLKVHEVAPEIFEQRAQLEEEFGHEIIRGGDREHITLRELLKIGLKRKVNQRERIEIGACECGD
jgi:hypothetical protein